jgi:hypothetical protein
MPVVRRDGVARWVDLYERAWRTPGTSLLSQMFTPTATYQPCEGEPARGLDEIAVFWEAERVGPDEPFTMSSEIVAVEDDTAIVRVTVEYEARGERAATRWRNLWVIRFTAGGRCAAFEEWSSAPDRIDGHRAPSESASD